MKQSQTLFTQEWVEYFQILARKFARGNPRI